MAEKIDDNIYSDGGDETQTVDIILSVEAQIGEDVEKLAKQVEDKLGKTMEKEIGIVVKGSSVSDKSIKKNAKEQVNMLQDTVKSLSEFDNSLQDATTATGAFTHTINDATGAVKKFEAELNNFKASSSAKSTPERRVSTTGGNTSKPLQIEFEFDKLPKSKAMDTPRYVSQQYVVSKEIVDAIFTNKHKVPDNIQRAIKVPQLEVDKPVETKVSTPNVTKRRVSVPTTKAKEYKLPQDAINTLNRQFKDKAFKETQEIMELEDFISPYSKEYKEASRILFEEGYIDSIMAQDHVQKMSQQARGKFYRQTMDRSRSSIRRAFAPEYVGADDKGVIQMTRQELRDRFGEFAIEGKKGPNGIIFEKFWEDDYEDRFNRAAAHHTLELEADMKAIAEDATFDELGGLSVEQYKAATREMSTGPTKPISKTRHNKAAAARRRTNPGTYKLNNITPERRKELRKQFANASEEELPGLIIGTTADLINNADIKGNLKTTRGKEEVYALQDFLYKFMVNDMKVPYDVFEETLLRATPNAQYVSLKRKARLPKLAANKGGKTLGDFSTSNLVNFASKDARKFGFGNGMQLINKYESYIKSLDENYEIGSLLSDPTVRFTDTSFDRLSLDELTKLGKNVFDVQYDALTDTYKAKDEGLYKMLFNDQRYWNAFKDRGGTPHDVDYMFGQLADPIKMQYNAMIERLDNSESGRANPFATKTGSYLYGPAFSLGKFKAGDANIQKMFTKDPSAIITTEDGRTLTYEGAMSEGLIDKLIVDPKEMLENYMSHNLSKPETFATDTYTNNKNLEEYEDLISQEHMKMNLQYKEASRVLRENGQWQIQYNKDRDYVNRIFTNKMTPYRKTFNDSLKFDENLHEDIAVAISANNLRRSIEDIDRILKSGNTTMREFDVLKQMPIRPGVNSSLLKYNYERHDIGSKLMETLKFPEINIGGSNYTLDELSSVFKSPTFSNPMRRLPLDTYASIKEFNDNEERLYKEHVRDQQMKGFMGIGYTPEHIEEFGFEALLESHNAFMSNYTPDRVKEEHQKIIDSLNLEAMNRDWAEADKYNAKWKTMDAKQRERESQAYTKAWDQAIAMNYKYDKMQPILAEKRYQQQYGASIRSLDKKFFKGEINLEEYVKELYKLGMSTEEVSRAISDLNAKIISNAKAAERAKDSTNEFNNEMLQGATAAMAYSTSINKAATSMDKLKIATEQYDKVLDTLGIKRKKKGGSAALYQITDSQLGGLATGTLMLAFQQGRKIDDLITELSFQASDGGNVISWSGIQNDNWGNIDAGTQARYEDTLQDMKQLAYITTTSFTGMLGAAVEVVKAGADGATAKAILGASALVADMEEMDILEVIDGMLGAGRAMGLTTDQGTGEEIQDWMNFYADVLLAADATGSSVQDVINGLRYISPVVSLLDMSMEEGIALSAILGNVGLAGQKGARTMASGLIRLATPTDKAKELMESYGLDVYNADGSMKDLPTIITEFQEVFKTLETNDSAALGNAVFGKDAMKGFSGLGAQAQEYKELVDLLNADDTGKYMAERYAAEFWGVAIEDVTQQTAKLNDELQSLNNGKTMDNISAAVELFESMSGVEIDWELDLSESIMRNMADLKSAVMIAKDEFLKAGGSVEEWGVMVEAVFADVEEDLEELQVAFQQFYLGGLADSNPYKVIGIGLMSMLEGLIKVGNEVADNLAHITAQVLPNMLDLIEDINEELAADNIDENLSGLIGDAATLSLLFGILKTINKIAYAMRWPLLISMKLNDETDLLAKGWEGVVEAVKAYEKIMIRITKLKMVGEIAGAAFAIFEMGAEFIDALLESFEMLLGFFGRGGGKGSLGRFSKKGKKEINDPYKDVLGEINDGIKEMIKQSKENTDDIVDATKDSDSKDVDIDKKKKSDNNSSSKSTDGNLDIVAGAAIGSAGSSSPEKKRRGKTGSTGLGPLSTTVLAGIAAIPGPWLTLLAGAFTAFQVFTNQYNSAADTMISVGEVLFESLPVDTQNAILELYTMDQAIQIFNEKIPSVGEALYDSLPEESQEAMSLLASSGWQIQAISDALPKWAEDIWEDLHPMTQAAIIELGGVKPVLEAMAKEFPEIGKLIQKNMEAPFYEAKTEAGAIYDFIKNIRTELETPFNFMFTYEYNGAWYNGEGDEMYGPPPSMNPNSMYIPPVKTSFGLSDYDARGLGSSVTNHNNNDNRIFNINYNVEQGKADSAFDQMVTQLRGM